MIRSSLGSRLMHGIIFVELKKYVHSKAGTGAALR
jgi:hypothetical protein